MAQALGMFERQESPRGRNIFLLLGLLYVPQQCAIRKIVISTGEVTTFAGVQDECRRIDGSLPEARLSGNGPIWGDEAYLYVADGVVRRIRLSNAEATTLVDPMGALFEGVKTVVGDEVNLLFLVLCREPYALMKSGGRDQCVQR
jgi:hypothetical protein